NPVALGADPVVPVDVGVVSTIEAAVETNHDVPSISASFEGSQPARSCSTIFYILAGELII
ncbi:MAG TPA: hypothetical protein VK034_12285, partial [Enhygromyxa sp.]|nr:hypothetical protein [Enhygromyxa sp.]